MFSFFKRRDTKIYPKDEIGDAMYREFPDPGSIPDKVFIWYDVYFDKETDADRMAEYLNNRNIEIIRDHDDDPGDGLGHWNIDFEIAVKARHIDLSMAHADMLRNIESFNGHLPGWNLSKYEED